MARHANAGRLWLDLEEAGVQVRLEIRDDGVGFQPVPSSALVRAGRFGLAGMRERAELLGGRLSAGPAGNGWLVDCSVPLRGSNGTRSGA